jgi:hypothetical protein
MTSIANIKHEESVLRDFTGMFGLSGNLNGQTIPRDMLTDGALYTEIQKMLPLLRSIYSSHSMSCLHKNCTSKQAFPSICILRQVLKVHGYLLKPTIKCDGYSDSGKKRTKRFFSIERIELASE